MNEERESRRGGPPRLRLGLIKKFKALLIANVIPFIIIAYLIYGYKTGQIGLRDDVDYGDVAVTLGALFLACVILGASSWVVLPIGKWLCDYPAWHMRNSSAAVWAIPWLLGYAIYGVIWILVLACLITAVAVIILAFTRLLFAPPVQEAMSFLV